MTLLQSLSNYNDDVEKVTPTYSGLLGLAIGGSRKVQVPNRAGFVYVRLRDSLSEVVQVYNDKVSPIYDLPVIIHRKHNRWFVLSKDDGRYENWGTNSPYLPLHGGQHSLNRDTNSGGDVVFVYPDQFMPLLVYPSGTAGAGMVWVAPYLLQRENDFVYVGNTGTVNLLQYCPTDDQAILGLVCLNRTTGNPEVLIASGTPASASQTGTSYISGYLPYPESHQEPLYAVRLVSGTTAVKWENLYNARQLFGGIGGGSIVTGSSGGTPAGSDGDIQYNDDGAFGASSDFKRESNGTITIGTPSPHLTSPPYGINQGRPSGSTVFYQWSFGDETIYPRLVGYHARGTLETSSATLANDILLGLIGRGYWAADSPNTAGAEIRVVASENHDEGKYGTHFEFWTIPTGTSTRTKIATIDENGINLVSGKSYRVNDVPIAANTDYITGLKISFVSTTSISVGIGSAYVDGDILTVSSPIAVSSITAVDDIYHVYLYDNSGTPAIELSTTDPGSSAYFGTARTKNGDTSRRYLGSILCTSAGGVQNFSHLPNSGYLSYTNVATPKRIVSGGTATTKTTVSVDGATPPTATAIQILAINTSTNANLFIVDTADVNFLVVPATLRAAATAPLDGVNIYYKMSTAPSGGSTFIDVLGYYFER